MIKSLHCILGLHVLGSVWFWARRWLAALLWERLSGWILSLWRWIRWGKWWSAGLKPAAAVKTLSAQLTTCGGSDAGAGKANAPLQNAHGVTEQQRAASAVRDDVTSRRGSFHGDSQTKEVTADCLESSIMRKCRFMIRMNVIVWCSDSFRLKLKPRKTTCYLKSKDGRIYLSC